MQITKYGHACFIVEKNGASIIIDPGAWSGDLEIPADVAAIVVTHAHPDHGDAKLLDTIKTKSPECIVYAHDSVASLFPDLGVTTVNAGDTISVSGFELRLTGGEHALIHESIPKIANLGIVIDESVYYPGDSFADPGVSVQILALPVSAPWMKLAEAIDFYTRIKPRHTFPTHDAILSDTGKQLVDSMLGSVAESLGTSYERLDSGKSLTV